MFLSRGERDLGVAFQTHPGRQASIASGSKEPRSALESRRGSLGVHPVGSKRYPSRLESRAGFFASTRDECLSPRVRLECNPEIPIAPGEEARFLDTSLDEVYWPCSHSRAIPSFPSQLECKIGLAWANTRPIATNVTMEPTARVENPLSPWPMVHPSAVIPPKPMRSPPTIWLAVSSASRNP